MSLPTVPAAMQTASTTKLEVAALGATTYLQVPYELTDDIKWTPDATSEDFLPYSDGLAVRRVVKTGLSAAIEVTVAGSAANAVVKLMCEAGDAINEDSRLRFKLTEGDGTVHEGVMVVMPAKPVTGPRNIFKRTFMCPVDGEYTNVYPVATP